MSTTIKILQANIVDLDVDAIVNAANQTLLGGGGVDGAIHKAAGPDLLIECKKVGPCPPGEARVTKGYNLKARYVIHAVGPVWEGGDKNEDIILASCYKSTLDLAVKQGIKTIAFPAISTGIFGFPKDRAARIALEVMRKFEGPIDKIYLVAFDQETFECFKKAF